MVAQLISSVLTVANIAHHIRSRSSKRHEAALAISKLANCRWCLSGTPIQNTVDDYGALLSFLQVPKLSAKRAFDQWISKPIRNKQSQGLDRLQDLIRATCLRRTIASLPDSALNLEPRAERIEWINLNEEDKELYAFFQRKAANIARGVDKRARTGTGTGASKFRRRRQQHPLPD
jgi:SNF2 family DNA or RNA helicase